MPWKERHVMDERLRFIARLLEGEKMAPLCGEFGISRKTGYKIFDRYKDCGVQAFTDRSRRPHRQANRLPAPIEATIVRLKREYHRHGAVAADRTECAVVRRLQRRVHARQPAVLLSADDHRFRQPVPVDLRGAADDAGEIRLHRLRADVQRVWIAADDSDRQWRAVCLGTRALRPEQALGLVAPPRRADRADQTRPSATKRPARADASHVQEGSDETAAPNVLQKQARFDSFVEQYNRQRPHQALGMKVPADFYARSPRVYRGLDDLTYPFHDQTIAVTRCGQICFKGRKVNLSHVFAGQNVGVTQVGERIWLVTFMQYNLGYFDDEPCRLEPIENPFGPKVLPMSPE
jgi:putative transposase